MTRFFMAAIALTLTACATRGPVISLHKYDKDGHYYISANDGRSSNWWILIDARTEIGSYTLCSDQRDYVLLRYYHDKNNIDLQNIKSGKLVKIGEADSLYGDLSCTAEQVVFTTKTNQYVIKR